MLKDTLNRIYAGTAEPTKMKPRQKHIVGDGMSQSHTIGLFGAGPAISSISTRAVTMRMLLIRRNFI
jgi:hypothetical protein